MGRKLILTCEHASNRVPPHLVHLFSDSTEVLESHRAYDAGAREVALELARLCGSVRTFMGEWSRLVVDLNRSEFHPKIFSAWTKALPLVDKEHLLDSIYRPFRMQVCSHIQSMLARGEEVLHLSIHSFTPVLGDQVRENDIGLLYDPKSNSELEFALRWQKSLESQGLRVRRNFPYRGASDGHSTALRKKIPRAYQGIEVEINQALFGVTTPKAIAEALALVGLS